MNFRWAAVGGLSIFVLIGFWLLQSAPDTAVNNRRGPNLAAQPGEQPQEAMAFYVSEPVESSLSPAVRDLPVIAPEALLDRELNPRHNPLFLSGYTGEVDLGEQTPDALAQRPLAPGDTPPLLLSFAGLGGTQAGGAVPPDTVGDIGPNHYIQMVNVRFAIYDRQGAMLAGPTAFNQLFADFGGSCQTSNAGDPIVLYDAMADRWLMAQFTLSNFMCIVVSQTGDPLGAYHRYAFSVPEFPDYFKFGVWPDGYYMSANENTYTAYAFNRAAMLTGAPATYQRFSGGTNFLMPSDLDGPTLPPAGSPNYFYTFKDQTYHGGGVDRIEVWAFDVDFVTPANTTFTLNATVPVTPFNYTVCGFFVLSCIHQGGTTQRVDPVSEWPMFRLPYRNFGAHETLVGNFAIDVTGADQSGIRWFELRKSGAGGWTLYQEGTHAPDALHRWMGSIAMDQDGNIALGYSVSSSSMFPALRYTVRTADDPLGTLQAEQTLIDGAGSQTGANRWGDYSAMSVDPVDDCTFWYTNEYYTASSSRNWATRVATFKVPGCGEADEVADLSLVKTAVPTPALSGQPITYTLAVTNLGPDLATGVQITDTLPAGVTFVSAQTSRGVCTEVGGVVSCTLTGVANGATAVVTVVVIPNQPGELSNMATTTANEPDPDPDNNSDTLLTTVLPQADLALAKTAVAPTATIGQPITYTLTITNQGPSLATAVLLTDTLPPSVTFISANSATGNCTAVGGVVSCEWAELAIGETAVVTLVVAPTLPGELTNSASVTAAEADANPTNNTAVATLIVGEGWRLWLPLIIGAADES
jgi:uncharacterized repeat protein (TIGR01451 family)